MESEPGRILSIAAYPPPTWWHPFPDVHWDESYFRQVASRCDQLAVMMYDAGQRIPKTYQKLMADWTVEVLNWSETRPVLLGVPTYDDAEVDLCETEAPPGRYDLGVYLPAIAAMKSVRSSTRLRTS